MKYIGLRHSDGIALCNQFQDEPQHIVDVIYRCLNIPKNFRRKYTVIGIVVLQIYNRFWIYPWPNRMLSFS